MKRIESRLNTASAEFQANAEAKEKLLAEAERIDVSDAKAAQSAFRAIGDKWDAIGKAPREKSADLERRLRAVEKKVREAGTVEHTDAEAQARADLWSQRVRARRVDVGCAGAKERAALNG